MYTNKISWFLSSNPQLGASSVDQTGSNFTVQLTEPFTIPHNASNVTVELQQAIIWNSSINVTTNVNDRFNYSVNGVPTVVSVPQGNYDLTSLGETIAGLMARNVPAVSNTSFVLYLRGAYCVMELYVRGAAYITDVTFGGPANIGSTIGFDPQTLVYTNPATVGSSQPFLSDRAPPIKDGTKEILLSSTLVARGVRVNGKFSSVLAKITFGNTAPGSQLIYNPPRPNVVPADLGAGRNITTVQSFLTDAATGNPINTNGEYWSYVAVIKYDMPLYEEPGMKKRRFMS